MAWKCVIALSHCMKVMAVAGISWDIEEQQQLQATHGMDLISIQRAWIGALDWLCDNAKPASKTVKVIEKAKPSSKTVKAIDKAKPPLKTVKVIAK